jgi:glycosyltransferase involved in cell wall biosynthesis
MLRIVFVGNLIARKGLHTLLDAFARLPSNTAQLTIIVNPNTDLNYTRLIRNKISDLHLANVEIVGSLPDAELANTLGKSHVLIVPSQYEGFGIVYLEGTSFGLPAIGTTAGGASEIICDGENGFLVSPNDANALATRIETLARDRKRLAQMGLAARRRFLAHPTWDESMEQIRQKLMILKNTWAFGSKAE